MTSTNQILKPEEYAAMHKAAFRVAFDFLNAHFPPGEGYDWWIQVAKDADTASMQQGENKLVIGMLAGIMDYLQDEWKKRRALDEQTDN